MRYGADDLAALAEHAYDFMSEREPGTPKVRCETVPLTASGERKAVSVIEIVNDDMPFLVDSVMGEIADRRLDVRLVAHPVFGVRRDGNKLAALGAPDGRRQARESSSIFISRRSPTRLRATELVARIAKSCSPRCGWRCRTGAPCATASAAIVTELKTNPPPLPVDEIAEAIQFLQWLLADNFTFLGVRDYIVDGQALEPEFESALGIMRSRELRVLRRGTELLEFTPEIMAFLKEPRPLIIAKANIHARVHRRVYLDYIGVKRFDACGQSDRRAPHRRAVHLHRLYAHRAQHPVSAPQDRRGRAARRVSIRAAIPARRWPTCWSTIRATSCSRSMRTRSTTLRSQYLQLDERPRVRVLARRDRFDRFVSVLVFVPRERYDSHIRVKIGAYLGECLHRARLGVLSVFSG